MTDRVNIDEGERLLAELSKYDLLTQEHLEAANNWVAWMYKNARAEIAELRELREFKTANIGYAQLGKGFFEMIDMADAVRAAEQVHNLDRTDAMIQVWMEQRRRIQDLELQVAQLTQARDAGENDGR